MEKRSAQYDGYIRAFPLQSTFAAPMPAAYGSFAGSPYHQPYAQYMNAYPQYGPFVRQQPAAYPNALFAPEQRWLLTFSTSTSTKTSTSSSTPTCSTTSSFSACGSG